MSDSPILVTGFTPFGNFTYNSSAEILTVLDGLSINGRQLVTACITTDFDRCLPDLIKAREKTGAGAVINLGMRADSSLIHIETRGRNVNAWTSSRERLDTGQPLKRIRRNGSNFLPVTWNVTKLKHKAKSLKIPLKYSFNAGSYVCNYLIYSLVDHIKNSGKNFPYVFIHIPAFPGDAGKGKSRGMNFYSLYHHLCSLIGLLIDNLDDSEQDCVF